MTRDLFDEPTHLRTICNKEHYCADNGDRLIHQTIRAGNESSSGFGQWINTYVQHIMFLMDIDAALFANRNRVLRIIEQKPLGGTLKISQQTVLPILAIGVKLLIEAKIIHPSSGVFLVQTDDSYEQGYIRPIQPVRGLALGPEICLEGDAFKSFLQCDDYNHWQA